MRRLFKPIAVAGLIAYAGVAGFMTVFQRSFLFRQAPEWQSPADHGLPQATREGLTTADGIRLSGWWIAPKREDAPVFLYFHGNADGLSRRALRFGIMTAEGEGLLALSYRGYGGSEGKPSEAALHADARAAYNKLAESVAPSRIVIFGESLGTGIALNLARTVKARAVVLDSPYLSVVARARASYPWLPVSWLLVDQFRSDIFIRHVDEPVLILHGDQDDLIPLSDSEKLAGLGEPRLVKRIVYPGQPHVVRYNQGPDRDVRAWLGVLP